MKDLKLDVSGGGKLTSEEIDALYNAMKDGMMDDASSLVGQCTSDACYEDAATALHERFPQFSIEALKYFVRLKDPEVLKVLLANAQHASPDGFTTDELLNITDISTWFNGNTAIESFEELEKTKITALKSLAFAECTNLNSIKLPDSCTSIYSDSGYVGVFNRCTSLEEINLNNVTYLGSQAFFGCTNLKAVTAPNLSTIEKGINRGLFGAQNSIYSLTSFIAPKLNVVGDFAFCGKCNITGLELKSVTAIKYNAFRNSNIEKIILPETPPTLDSTAFSGCNAKFIVKNESVKNVYLATPVWNTFSADRFVVE